MIGTKAQQPQSVATPQRRGQRKIRLMIAGAVLVAAAGAGVGTYEATARTAPARTTTVQTSARLGAFEQLKQESYPDPTASQRLNAFKGLKNGQ